MMLVKNYKFSGLRECYWLFDDLWWVVFCTPYCSDVSEERSASIFRVTILFKWLRRNEYVSYMGRLEEIWPVRFLAGGIV